MTGTIFKENGTVDKPNHDPARALAQALGDARPEGRRWRTSCPACGGHNLTVGLSDDGQKLLVFCWNGCSQPAVIERLKALGLWGGALSPGQNGHRPAASPVSPASAPSPRAASAASPASKPAGRAANPLVWLADYCGVTDSFVSALPIAARGDWVAFTFPSGAAKLRRAGSKDIRWDIPAGAGRPALWPLPSPDEALPEDVWLLESETDAVAGRRLGLPAYAVTAGASTPLRPAEAEALRQRGVRRATLVYDADAAGREGARKQAEVLARAGIAVAVVDLAGAGLVDVLAGEKDLRDSFRAAVARGESPERLRQALKAAARPWTPGSTAGSGGEAGEAAGAAGGAGGDGEGARERRWDPCPLSALGDGEGADVDWVWDGFLGRGLVTELYGFWKSGKTTLVAALLARMTPGSGPDSILAAKEAGFARKEFRPAGPGAGDSIHAPNTPGLARIEFSASVSVSSAASAAAGAQAVPRRDGEPGPGTAGPELAGRRVTPGRVLVVSEEPAVAWARRRDELELSDHVHALTRPFTKRATWDEWEALLAHIAGLVRAHGYSLVTFDSLSALWPVADENDAGQVLRALAPLHGVAEAGCAVLLVHHPRKSDGNEATAGRGSGALAAFVDVIVEFRRADPSRIEDRRRVLSVYSRFAEPGETVVEWRGGADYVTLGSRAEADRKDRWQTLEAVLADLAETGGGDGATLDQVLARWEAEAGTDAVRPGRRTLAADLEAAVRAGRLTRTGAGRKGDPFRYKLAAPADPAVALVGDGDGDGGGASAVPPPGADSIRARSCVIGARIESAGVGWSGEAGPGEPDTGPAALTDPAGADSIRARSCVIGARIEFVEASTCEPGEGPAALTDPEDPAKLADLPGEPGEPYEPDFPGGRAVEPCGPGDAGDAGDDEDERARVEMVGQRLQAHRVQQAWIERHRQALRELAAKYPLPDIPLPTFVSDDPRGVWVASDDAAEMAWELDARRGFRRRRRRRRR